MDLWMRHLPDYVKKRGINKIIVPGTHDSGAYQVNFTTPVGSVPEKFGAYVGRFFSGIGNIIIKWTQTDIYNIYQQLMMGIRALDLRISYNQSNETFYVTHTFACEVSDDVLEQISRFTAAHPSEAIILNVKPDFANVSSMTAQTDQALMQKFINKLGNSLFPTKTENSTSRLEISNTIFPIYADMISIKRPIILSYTPAVSLTNPNLLLYNWPYGAFNQPWDNTSSLTTKEVMMSSDMATFLTTPYYYNSISFTLTPQVSDIILDVLKRLIPGHPFKLNSIATLSQEIDSYLDEFLNKYDKELIFLSSVTFDFPNKELIEKIVKLNR